MAIACLDFDGSGYRGGVFCRDSVRRQVPGGQPHIRITASSLAGFFAARLAYRLQRLLAAGFGSLQDSENRSLGTRTDVTANIDDRLNGGANHAGRGCKQ